jgi:two-component system, NtrC family, sensor histidine kinase GlrK
LWCLELKKSMRLTIFWRIILAQSALIALAFALGLYAFTQLNGLIRLHSSILTIDTSCINEEKRLLKIFLAEMRSAEKYLISRDNAFYTGFVQSGDDFAGTLAAISALVDTQREKELTDEIRELQSRYSETFHLAATILASSKKGPLEPPNPEVGDGILERIHQLIRIREQTVENKTAAARDQAVNAANVMFWLTLGGIAGALLLAYLHARGVSLPLRKLAEGMHRVGKGKFHRSLDSKASKEVSELLHAFNRMSLELAELDRLKADFTAHISHELRTPLTAIREGTALLQEEIAGPLTDSQREIIDVVCSHSDRLFHGISSILDLSKMEAEMMEYEYSPSDPAALIYRSIDDFILVARKKEIDLQTSVADDLPLLVLDERRIQQVLDNLLSNALKFTPEGGNVCVTASLHRRSNGTASHVEIIVSDTGQGIPEDDLEKVFKRFYQSSGNTGKKHPGTGLGLAIARHIVEAHSGYIWAESAVGEGSKFIFTLPVATKGGEIPPAGPKG